MPENKVGNITIYLNVFKKEDTEPRYRGKLDINGVSYSISLWSNDSIKGVSINMSGQITEKVNEQQG